LSSPLSSYLQVMPAPVLERYDFFETRNAARILQATNSAEASDLFEVLENFAVDEILDIVRPGGNESDTPSRLNAAFRQLAWREGSYAVTVTSKLVLRALGFPAERATGNQTSARYNIDNLKERVVIDTEWHAKDGNLDRDIASYRSLYDAGIIDCAVMVTMTRTKMQAWAKKLDPASKKFSTTTTTNLEKVRHRLLRGDSGGRPIWIVAVCERTT